MPQVQYDLLVGADGVGSTVRSEMEHQLPGMSGETCTAVTYSNAADILLLPAECLVMGLVLPCKAQQRLPTD